MQTIINHIYELGEKTEQLAATRARIWKLQAVEKAAGTVADMASRLIIALCFVLALLTGSVGLALLAGSLLHHPAAGFFIIGGFYLLAGLVLYRFRKQGLQKIITRYLVRLLV